MLVAIAIPVFTNQLEKSQEATDISNIRSYYAEITPALITKDLEDKDDKISIGNTLEATLTSDIADATTTTGFTVIVAGKGTNKLEFQQTQEGWQTAEFDIAGVKGYAKTDTANATNNKVTQWEKEFNQIEYHFSLADDGDYLLTEIVLSTK